MTRVPRVSALMVTRNRVRLSQRSLACLAAQSWPNLELVVIDDGDEDYAQLLATHAQRMSIQHLRVAHDPQQKLGALRNLALERATGEYLVQWDDDEWYHPGRIEAQVAFLREHALDAVVLQHYLMHLDTRELGDTVFRAEAPGGMPGSILHRPTHVRYPNRARSEDLAFQAALEEHGRVGCMPREDAHLLVRCYHGTNTWDLDHFVRRLWRTPRNKLQYVIARFVRRELRKHPAFVLDARQRESAARFFEDSRALGLLAASAA